MKRYAASSQPITEWRYRFGPLQEREQKRQYLSDVPAGGLAWTYTLLGADAKQLASYNGIQGAFCGQPPTSVWLWPVEYNSYGPAHTRVITRPGGTPEYVLHDHLGSARITLDNAARVIESQSYTAYGDHRTHDGEAARTSYIGRETDKESDLGFGACPEALRGSVRLYDPTYGRFLSVDPLWGKYLPLQSYQYAANNPVMMLDDGGDTIVFFTEKARAQYNMAKEQIVTANPEAAAYYAQVENSEDHFILRTNGHGYNSFEPLATGDGAYRSTSEKRVHGINWDPTHAASLGSMGALSPSMILFHEILHAAGRVDGGASYEDDGTVMTNPEERRVISIENVVAKVLGQAVRDCHKCPDWKYFVVKKPTEGGRPASESRPEPRENPSSMRDEQR